ISAWKNINFEAIQTPNGEMELIIQLLLVSKSILQSTSDRVGEVAGEEGEVIFRFKFVQPRQHSHCSAASRKRAILRRLETSTRL
ncbi:hypothetical protein scyTo_0018442, partial [Scyliorhinus torazame]|nr:hypothetical protein [Scyliorhinus torazame]